MRRLLPVLLLCAPALMAQSGAAMAGDWAGSLQLPGAELKLSITLVLSGATWTGRISIPAQGVADLPLGELQVSPEKVSFMLVGIPGDPRFQVRPAGTGRLEGILTQRGQSFPLTLTRAVAVAPSEAPKGDATDRAKDRELAFPGFNAFPLKGSVRPGGDHPYFAVMVAGSGPTDRDWSNPLIPVPSHGGRDFAAWLQGQGIGSLRYDKRFIGSKDPRLDISLDAQKGDISAALKAARALPDAKGKKLLLVGHSEGALLSLLVAGEADAALLLAMPGMSMGKLITAQVRGQLEAAGAPADASALNLAYLGFVLEAIRKDKALPQAAPEVAPGLVALGHSLARPESRGFVRDLLDLDPWGAAQRLAVPCAVAWGDRDVQTWKPEKLPEGFKGAVIQIPEANHLFKREIRDKAGLSGLDAATTYGDSTPLADLSPLAVWLKQLK